MKDVGLNRKAEVVVTASSSSTGKKMKRSVSSRKRRLEPDWETLRSKYCGSGVDTTDNQEDCTRAHNTKLDHIDYNAVLHAHVSHISKAIFSRGMNNNLAERILGFLHRLVDEHGGYDVEWLRSFPPELVKKFLMSIRGFGLKSAECVRLLALNQKAFPVDTNVARVALRLGWVPVPQMSEEFLVHVIDRYSALIKSIHAYLWPFLSQLEQKTLYELHCQFITLGKVFCTKRNPNCGECPIKGYCKYYTKLSSETESSRGGSCQLRRHGKAAAKKANSCDPKEAVKVTNPGVTNSSVTNTATSRAVRPPRRKKSIKSSVFTNSLAECPVVSDQPYEIRDIEDIIINEDCLGASLRSQQIQASTVLDITTASSSSYSTSPVEAQRIKRRSGQRRTIHFVYELPDCHPALASLSKRDPDDPIPYLLAIWQNDNDHVAAAAGSMVQYHDREGKAALTSCDVKVEEDDDCLTVPGTILLPDRTALKASFPLNATYFQTNEVFADQESSLCPIAVQFDSLKDLSRKTLYCGSSLTTVMKGLTADEIKQFFAQGYLCTRSFDRGTSGPKPLSNIFHQPAPAVGKKTAPRN